MRNIYTFLIAIALLSSCRSIEKMVETGNYDKAFDFAIDKLAGKKDKESKYVKGLEKAFVELQARDMAQINYILNSPHDHLWADVASLYTGLTRRQNALRPILPLVSEDGYRARFDLVDYTVEIAEAKEKAADYKYFQAMDLMELADRGDKFSAQKAYALFGDVLQYNPKYKDAVDMREDAYDLGLERYGIEFTSNVPARVRPAVDAEISNFNASRYNSFWKKYYVIKAFEENDMDGIFSVSIDDVDYGVEREMLNNFDMEKIITDGYRPVLDNRGVEKRDSLGKVITEPNNVKVKAFVTEIKREKAASLIGNIRYFAHNTNYAASTTPIEVNFIFADNAADFRGDVRALDRDLIALTRKNLLAFPDNYEVTGILADQFFDEVAKRLPSIRIYNV